MRISLGISFLFCVYFFGPLLAVEVSEAGIESHKMELVRAR